jgi:hypothetical protein
LNALNGCGNKLPKKPSAIEVISKNFSEEQILKVEEQFSKYLDQIIFYRLPSTVHLLRKEWTILKPLFINSDYNRMVAFIPNWRIANGKASTSMIWFVGFYNDEKWYFFGRNEVQYMNYKDRYKCLFV